MWTHRFTAEDAFIYHRVVGNVVAGNGPVFNAGERVEATTSLLWTGTLSLVRLIAGDRVGVGTQAVAVGGALAVLGLALAIAGSVEIQARRRTGRVLYVPIGALIFATTPMFWYWGTSGLETGLQLAWLGACWFGLCHRAVVRSAVDRPRWLLVLISLGPMVRPELAIYSVVLGAVILVGSGPPERSRSTLRALAWLLTPALGLQLARMGYYGSLLPNTALAKDGGRAAWSQGLTYVDASLLEGWFWVGTLVSLGAVAVIGWGLADQWRRLLVLGAPLIAAVLNLVYVIRIGGDDVPDRFTVLPLFALSLPAAALAVPLSWSIPRRVPITTAAVALLGLAWAVTALVVNPLSPSTTSPYVTDYLTVRTNPVELTDLLTGTQPPPEVAAALQNEDDVLLVYPFGGGTPVPRHLPRGSGVQVGLCCVGSEAAGLPLDVRVIDESSLADPIGARLVRDAATDLAMDGKLLPEAWAIVQAPAGGSTDSPDVAAGRRALQCGDLAELHAATTEPLTPGRFFSNIVGAARLTTVQVPASTLEAEALFCDT